MKLKIIISIIALSLLAIIPAWGQKDEIKRKTRNRVLNLQRLCGNTWTDIMWVLQQLKQERQIGIIG